MVTYNKISDLQLFDSDSEENFEFYGFGQEEIDALRRDWHDCDSGSEFDFAGDMESSFDSDSDDGMSDQDARCVVQ